MGLIKDIAKKLFGTKTVYRFVTDEEVSFLTEFARFNEANEHLSINCDCIECRFNYKDLCTKENVNISGFNAETRQQTKCDSFEKRW